MISSLQVGHSMSLRRRRKPPLFTVYGKLIGTHYIKTPNNRLFRLSERRDDELGVYMFWTLRLTKHGKYDVIKRLDPRYCEHIDELYKQSCDKMHTLVSNSEGE